MDSRKDVDETMAEGDVDIEIIEPKSDSDLDTRIPTMELVKIAQFCLLIGTKILLGIMVSRIIVGNKTARMNIEPESVAHFGLKTHLDGNEAQIVGLERGVIGPVVLLTFLETTSTQSELGGKENGALGNLADAPLIVESYVVEGLYASICDIGSVPSVETGSHAQDGHVATERFLLVGYPLPRGNGGEGEGDEKEKNSSCFHRNKGSRTAGRR